MSGKKRRFQLRSLRTRHAFTCTPDTKDAKNYCLHIVSRDLVLFFHDCCEFGIPVPLFCFICCHGCCSSKPFQNIFSGGANTPISFLSFFHHSIQTLSYTNRPLWVRARALLTNIYIKQLSLTLYYTLEDKIKK